MQPSFAKAVEPEGLEDPLAYLPLAEIHEYQKGNMIYRPDQSSTSLYLVVEGKVKISRFAGYDQQVVIDIYQADEFFGESVLLNLPRCDEQASALGKVKVMAWPAPLLRQLILGRPRLSLALLQIMVQRTIAFKQRIESFGTDKAACRLARSLVELSERLGVPMDDGSVKMTALTHEVISQYVGTTREIVTQYMNQFRNSGFLTYTRKNIFLYREPLREWLRQRA